MNLRSQQLSCFPGAESKLFFLNIFQYKERERKWQKICNLVKEEGLESLYKQMDELKLGIDFKPDIKELLYLDTLGKEGVKKSGQPKNIKEQHICDVIERIKAHACLKRHAIVKEKDGKGMEYVSNTDFINWDESVYSQPSIIFVPKTIEGLQNVVRWAQRENKRIRASGYGHTSAQQYEDKDAIHLSMVGLKASQLPEKHPGMNSKSNLQGIELVGEPYLKNGKKMIQCKIGASTSNYHLLDWVHSSKGGNMNWTQTENVIKENITFAGSYSLMCHGAGIQHKTISDRVTAIEFVNAKGELQTITDKAQLKTAAGCFGLLGFVTSMTIELEEMSYANLKNVEKKLFSLAVPPPKDEVIPQEVLAHMSAANIKALTDPEKLQQAFEEFKNHCQHNFYSEWFYFPFQDEVWVNCWDNDGNKQDSERYPGKLGAKFQEAAAYIAHLTTSSLIDECMSPWLRKIQAKIMGNVAMATLPHQPDINCTVQDALHFRRGIQNFKTRMMEMLIPVPLNQSGEPDWEIVQKVWWEAYKLIFSEENLQEVPWRTTMEMRIMGGSDLIMAPQHKNEITCAIEILTPVSVNEKNWLRFTQQVMDKWAAIKDAEGKFLNIRPHWAKRFQELNINRDKTWMEEWNIEQKQLLKKYVKKDKDTISLPMNVYLKTIAYQKELKDFKNQLKIICEIGGYRFEDMMTRFSNAFLDDLLSDSTPALSLLQNHSLYHLEQDKTFYTHARDKDVTRLLI